MDWFPQTMRQVSGQVSGDAQAGGISDKRLAELLVEKNDVQKADMGNVLRIQRSVGGRLDVLLLRTGTISEDLLLKRLAELSGAVYLHDSKALPETPEIQRFISESSIRRKWFLDNSVLMWRRDRQIFCITRDILDRDVFSTLSYFYPNEPITVCLAAKHRIDRLLDLLRRQHNADGTISSDNDRRLVALAEEAPIIEFVNNLLAQAVDLRASDIHIEPTEEHLAIRMRVDGVLHMKATQPIDQFPAIVSRIKLVSDLDISERRLPQDGRISARVAGQDMDIRVSTVPCAFGESVVLRMLAKERTDLTLSNLGMETDHLELFHRWLQASSGIVLVTGPTGSGKSTTLSSALAQINDGVKKLITVEDPVEHKMPNVTQIQTHAEIGYTFARALRAILRQDPDVIMIGEIRDLETGEIAIRSAMTGHLVLSTVHTNSALSSYTRLIDMGIAPFLVAASVRGVQAQRLVRTACPHCSVSVGRPELFGDVLQRLPDDLLGHRWIEVKGCAACDGTGYKGRTGVYELVPLSGELEEAIISGAKFSELKTLARRQGHRTLLEDALLKASRGRTTLEEVTRLSLEE